MADRPAASDAERERAAEFFAEARELEERKRYTEARGRYQESLRLYEDEEVRAAYHRLLSAIGPM
jgi:hypothetical protein